MCGFRRQMPPTPIHKLMAVVTTMDNCKDDIGIALESGVGRVVDWEEAKRRDGRLQMRTVAATKSVQSHNISQESTQQQSEMDWIRCPGSQLVLVSEQSMAGT